MASLELAREISRLGATVGVCIAPATPALAIQTLIGSGLVEMVNVLGVEPGRGGQSFQHSVLDKVAELRREHPKLRYIAVDGGVNTHTAQLAAAAGANVLIAGSSLLGTRGLEALSEAFESIEGALLKYGE